MNNLITNIIEKNWLYVLVLLNSQFLILNSAFSQTLTQTIRGVVVDADSKSPIEQVGVKVLNIDTNIYSITDADGKFRLAKVPVGRHTIKFSFIGYEDIILQNIIATTGKEVVLNVEMHEKLLMGNEVVIIAEKDKTKANNDLVTNSARNFQSEETERYAGSRGDPSKMVAAYAGVATGNDARNDIIVRGNSPLGVLWRLEGTDIPSPNHFSTQGATGGPVSILNNNLLGSSDFLTGAFPAEYGNKMSAVFDLKMRNGNNEKMEYTGQAGLNGWEGGIEGPLGRTRDKGQGTNDTTRKSASSNNGSYLINYRYNSLKLFQTLGINFGVSGIPTYQDLSYKINLPTSKAGVFTLWGIGGMSDISLLDSQKDSTDWSFTNLGEDLVFGSKMGVAGFSHLYFFTDKISGKLNVSVSGSQFKVTLDTLAADKSPFRVYTNASKDGQYFVNYTVTDKINAHHLLKTGYIWKYMMVNYESIYWSRNNKRYLNEFNEKGNTSSFQTFLHWQYRCTDNLTFNSGVHYNWFALTNSFGLEPRAGMRWQFLPKQTLSLAFGMHSQTLPLIYYMYKSFDSITNAYYNTNSTIDLSRSIHYVLAYDYNFAKDFRLKLECYYQDLYNLPIEKYHKSSFSTVNVGNELEGLTFVDSLENKGTGYNYGTEFTIEKFFSKKYYFLSSLSLYESKYKGSDGILRNTAFNGGYVYNLLGGIELPVGGKKNQSIAFDIKMTFAGGNRYTPIDIQQSILNKDVVYIDSLAFQNQFRDYQKIDFKISYRINTKKVSHYIFFHIENIFNRKNILQQVYNDNKKAITEEYQLGLFPYGGYRIEF
ncbi:MAG: TonB-dependent receptor [Bacteroidetes bacterium]|nr:TonB-dependent receptor [Bacteroidota bacterium]